MTAITDGEQVGFAAVLAFNGGTHASPTWATTSRVRDLSVPASKSTAKITSRASKYEYMKGVLLQMGLEFGYMYKRGTDTVFAALMASFFNKTGIEMWVGDDLITLTGAQGLRFYGEVMDMPQEQPLEDAIGYKFTIKPTPYWVSGTLIEPDWFTI